MPRCVRASSDLQPGGAHQWRQARRGHRTPSRRPAGTRASGPATRRPPSRRTARTPAAASRAAGTATATTPPGSATRAISRSAAARSGKNISAIWQSTRVERSCRERQLGHVALLPLQVRPHPAGDGEHGRVEVHARPPGRCPRAGRRPCGRRCRFRTRRPARTAPAPTRPMSTSSGAHSAKIAGTNVASYCSAASTETWKSLRGRHGALLSRKTWIGPAERRARGAVAVMGACTQCRRPDSGAPAASAAPPAVGSSGRGRRGHAQSRRLCSPRARAALAARGLGSRAARCSRGAASARTRPRPATASPVRRGVGRGLRRPPSGATSVAFAGYRARGEVRLPALIAGRELELPARGGVRERGGRRRVAGPGEKPGRRGGGVPGGAAGWSSPRRWRPTTPTRSTRTRRRPRRIARQCRRRGSARSARWATRARATGAPGTGRRGDAPGGRGRARGDHRRGPGPPRRRGDLLQDAALLRADARRAARAAVDRRSPTRPAAPPTTCGSRRSAGCTTAGS